MLTKDGEVISDGMSMISYLDRKLQEIVNTDKVATGIIVSTAVRKELSRACQHAMGVRKDNEIINRYRNVLKN